MKDKPDTTTTTAPAAPALLFYEVLADGPLKVGGALAFRTARLNLTKEQADALLTAVPGCIRFLGI